MPFTKFHKCSTCILFIVAATQLTSCSSLPKYEQPATLPQAKVRFILTNPEQYYGHLHSVDLNTCKLSADVGWLNGGREVDSIRVGMRDSPPIREGVVERIVVAEQRLNIVPTFLLPTWKWIYVLKAAQTEFQSAQPWGCAAPMFVPKTNGQYEYSITPGPGSCEIVVHTLELSPAGEVIRNKIDVSHDPAILVKKEMECPSANELSLSAPQ